MTPKHVLASTALCCLTLCSHAATPSDKRSVEPVDCVNVRYLLHDDVFENAIQMNTQGTRVAYLVKTPILAINQNRIDLYALEISSSGDKPSLLVSDIGLSQIRWLGDGKHLILLQRTGGKSAIFDIDVTTKRRKELAHISDTVREFSIDAAGHTLVYATESETPSNNWHSAEEVASGYQIPFQQSTVDQLPHGRVFTLTKRGHIWSSPRSIKIEPPLSQTHVSTFAHYRVYPLNLSLSPNGRWLIFSYLERTPSALAESPGNAYLNALKERGTSFSQVTICLDMITGSASVPLQSPMVQSLPLWSSDSRFFVANATAPVGSQWEQQDRQKTAGGYGMHVFSVEPATGQVLEVTAHDATQSIRALQSLYITSHNDVVVRTSADTILTFSRSPQAWEAVSEIHLPLADAYGHGQLASNGQNVIGEYQDALTPPQLFRWPGPSGGLKTIADLNPQFNDLNLVAPEHVSWHTSDGYTIHGALFLPSTHNSTQLLPLVIGTHPYLGQFVCDSGADHYPSLAPQPLASSGIAYLTRELSDDIPSTQDDRNHFPHGYPGGIGEAAFQMDVWDSAVNSLAAQGIVDRKKVGIIGFSRTGWYTEFILTHSQIPYRAATVTDNVEYSLGEYWLQHYGDVINGWDAMYGGPPFAHTLVNWQKYSISFNVDKVHTPLLMEEIGYGASFDDPKLVPLVLASHFELFTELNRLHRPAEMYFYPNEVHQPETPKARLASLQRNVDWYRFWLRGYERSNPEDPDQYKRWEHLRDLRDADFVSAPSSADSRHN